MKIDLAKFRKVTYPGITENKYLISENGDLYNMISGKFIGYYLDKDGYKRVCIDGKRHIGISRLVAYQFCPNADIRLVVDHIDGNKQNNHYTNLEWVTVRENTLRAERMGLRKVRGSDNGNSKYDEKMIHSICKLFEEGISPIEVYRKITGEKYLSQSNNKGMAIYQLIHKIKQRECWPDIVSQYKFSSDIRRGPKFIKPNEFHTFSEKEIRDICVMIKNEISPQEILSHMNISKDEDPKYRLKRDIIYRIRCGRLWKHIAEEYGIFERDTNYTSYKLDNEQLYEFAYENMSIDEIMKQLDCPKERNQLRLFRRAVSRRVNFYKKVIALAGDESLYIEIPSLHSKIV